MRLEYTDAEEKAIRVTELEAILENHLCDESDEEKLSAELRELTKS